MLRLKRVRHNYILQESKKDMDDLKDYLGDQLFDDYMNIRDRIPKDSNNFRDFSKLKKMKIADIQDFVSSFQSNSGRKKRDKSKGARKIYDGKEWVMYRIDTYLAAKLYGSGTKWCITGRYRGHEDKGEEYFNAYIQDYDLDDGYYFLINKFDPSSKFCILRSKSGKIDSIWNAGDYDLEHVNKHELPLDLLNYVNEMPLGDEIRDYLESLMDDPSEMLLDELSYDYPNIDKIKEWLYILYNNDRPNSERNLDEYYRMLIESDPSSSEQVFRELLNYYPPSDEFLSRYPLGNTCIDILIDSLKNNKNLFKGVLNQKYFDALLQQLFFLSDSSNKVFKDKNFITSVLSQCSDDVLRDTDIYKSMSNILSDDLLSNSDFIRLCKNKSLDFTDYLCGIVKDESFSYTLNNLAKAAVRHGLDLNEYMFNKLTAFSYILSNFNPTVNDVKWYLSHGADPDIKDAYGKTAIDYISDESIKNLLNSYR